jgi:hypothetical protein
MGGTGHMSVLVEAINVIVRKETLEHKYPGGLQAYEGDCPTKSFCADDCLTRVGFVHPTDVREFIDRLVSLGFVFHDGNKFVDVAVVDQRVGLTAPCDWLEVGRFTDGFAGCWLAGTEAQGRTPESLIATNLNLILPGAEADY